MKNIDELKKIAVLIDADNAQMSKLKLVIDELSAHGHIIIKRAYGDWANETLKNWKNTLNELAIQPIQQFAYTTKKNSTDSAMIIDAMDLLYTEKFDAFALVSSDSDFTRLASRLKESEIYVFGVGEGKTPISFRNACDDFIYTEHLGDKPTVTISFEEKKDSRKDNPVANEEVNNEFNIGEIVDLLYKAFEKYTDEELDGYVNVSSAGLYIKRVKPDFDSRAYGFSKLPELIKSLSGDFIMKKVKGKGTVNIVAYKPAIDNVNGKSVHK